MRLAYIYIYIYIYMSLYELKAFASMRYMLPLCRKGLSKKGIPALGLKYVSNAYCWLVGPSDMFKMYGAIKLVNIEAPFNTSSSEAS